MTQLGISGGEQDACVRALARLVPPDALITAPTRLRAYAAQGFKRGEDRAGSGAAPLAVVLARDTAQVQEVVRLCHGAGIEVLARGAGTNLTGANSASGDCVMICTGRMRRVIAFDPVGGLIRVEAGMRNAEVSAHVAAHGWFHAPDPSSRNSCTIGGNIGTNSGGGTSMRHGVTANAIAAVTLICPDGTRAELGGAGLQETGQGLAGLLCGAEGRLGIVTEALLRLCPASGACSALLAFDCEGAALAAARGILRAGIVSRQLDYLDAAALRLCQDHHPSGWPVAAGGLLLIELCGGPEDIDAQLGTLRAQPGQTCPAIVARTPAAAQALWAGRNRIYGATRIRGRSLYVDCAVPLSQFGAMLGRVRAICAAARTEVAIALHAGDGTVHAFVMYDPAQPGAEARAQACNDDIRLAACALGGSITAEYGVGTRNLHLLAAQFGPDDLAVQRRVIRAMRGAMPESGTGPESRQRHGFAIAPAIVSLAAQ